MTFYIGEDFTIEYSIDTDITGGSTVIKYKNPIGIVSSSAGTITDAASGIFSREISNTEIKIPGRYSVWAVITLATGKVTITKPRELWVLEQGTTSNN